MSVDEAEGEFFLLMLSLGRSWSRRWVVVN